LCATGKTGPCHAVSWHVLSGTAALRSPDADRISASSSSNRLLCRRFRLSTAATYPPFGNFTRHYSIHATYADCWSCPYGVFRSSIAPFTVDSAHLRSTFRFQRVADIVNGISGYAPDSASLARAEILPTAAGSGTAQEVACRLPTMTSSSSESFTMGINGLSPDN
jgi:hypothetical protein